MTCRTRWSAWAILITGLMLMLPAATGLRAAKNEMFAGESAKWARYESPHFELYSATDDTSSRDLLHNLELLRALFLDTFKFKERQPLPVSVFYFNREKDFFAYVSEHMRKNENLAGFYQGFPDRAVIVVSPAWDDEAARHVIFHEYVHHLVNTTGERPPTWFNEGMAEVLSTIEPDGDKVALGKSLPWHIETLRLEQLLPLETLFAVDYNSPIYANGRHTGLFYAESWALVHYLHYGRSGLDPAKVDLFLRYMQSEPANADPNFRRQLFRETMGRDYAQMERDLEHYVRDGSYTWFKAPSPVIPGAKTYLRSIPAQMEIRQRLAELDLRVNKSPRGRLELLNDLGPSTRDPRILEVLGANAFIEGDELQSRERWTDAIEAGSTNGTVAFELARLEGASLYRDFDLYFRLPEERAQLLRKLLKHAIEFAPERNESYEMLAWVEATVVKPDIANVNLVQGRFKTLKNKARTVLALALVRYHLGDETAATALLNQIDKLKPDYFTEYGAEVLLAKIEDRAPRRIERPELTTEMHLAAPVLTLPGK